MKEIRDLQLSFLTLIAALLFLPVCSVMSTEKPVRGFVRQMGTFVLDEKGSHLRIYPAKDNQPTYEIKRVIPGGHETDSQPEAGFFRGTGWFAYIETPDRIWLYDGKKHLNIFHRREKVAGFYSVATKEYYPACPADVWAALPDDVRTTLQQIGKAAIQK
jgi:hypothetical protein